MDTQKNQYNAPIIERIELDNEIALQLESAATPPKAPGEAMNAPEYFNNDPFKSNNAQFCNLKTKFPFDF